MKIERLFEWLLRLGLGVVFAYAGYAKLQDVQQFFLDISHFDLTSRDISAGLAMFLPWIEIATGLGLITRRLYLGAIALSAAMSLVFIAAIGSAWYRGLDLTCGCFGHENNATDYPRHLALNAGMLAAALGLGWLERRIKVREQVSEAAL